MCIIVCGSGKAFSAAIFETCFFYGKHIGILQLINFSAPYCHLAIKLSCFNTLQTFSFSDLIFLAEVLFGPLYM